VCLPCLLGAAMSEPDWGAFDAELRARVPELALELLGNPTFRVGQEWVISPFLTGCGGRTHAAIFSFIAGVMPPMAMLGRSLL
jgi:hypothetical protein